MLLLSRKAAEEQCDASKPAQQDGERAPFGQDLQFCCNQSMKEERRGMMGHCRPPSTSWLPRLLPPRQESSLQSAAGAVPLPLPKPNESTLAFPRGLRSAACVLAYEHLFLAISGCFGQVLQVTRCLHCCSQHWPLSLQAGLGCAEE